MSWLLTRFQDVSVILSAKYRWLRRSMALLGAGLLLAFLSAVVS